MKVFQPTNLKPGLSDKLQMTANCCLARLCRDAKIKCIILDHCTVSVHLIYREEEQHLQNITAMIEERLGNAAEPLMEMARAIEEKLFGDWVESLTDLFRNHVVS